MSGAKCAGLRAAGRTGVAAGKADLGWVGTRIFDTLGVTSFQA